MSGTLFFTSARNYLKRDPLAGSTNLAAPTTAAYSYFGLSVTNYTISHNLGYIPLFRVYYEPFGDGVIWPPLGTRDQTYAVNPLNTVVLGPGLIVWPTASVLNIQLFYSNNTLTGTYPVYWVIYKDVQL